jgi:hypothetical protein
MLNYVWCARCDRKYQAYPVRYVRLGNWERHLRKLGWMYRNYRWICPACTEPKEQKPAALKP